MSDVSVRPAESSDAGALARVYNHYVRSSTVTFEEAEVPDEEMARRVGSAGDDSLPWLVAQTAASVVGFACASRWKGRCAYRFTVESTVYVDREHTGKGVGALLYEALLQELRGQQVHSVIGGIALPNAPSVELHEKLGFVKVAHFEQVGFKFGQWVDVGYWQRLLT